MPESKARRQVIARPSGADPQRGYRVRGACIVAENPSVAGIETCHCACRHCREARHEGCPADA